MPHGTRHTASLGCSTIGRIAHHLRVLPDGPRNTRDHPPTRKRRSKVPQVPGFAHLDVLRRKLRWNDRSTPRRMLETFFFAVFCYDLAPELIVNAIDCLDYSVVGKDVGERNAALMAHELNSILTKQDIALYSVPDEKELAGERHVLVDRDPIHIVIARQPDGRWRFDGQTVGRIGMMRLAFFRGQREIQEARMRLAAGRTDPESTMRGFLVDAARRDFTAAARCLDLRDVPVKLRGTGDRRWPVSSPS